MRFLPVFETVVLAAVLGVSAAGQNPPGKDASASDKGIPARAAASEYLSHAQAGTVTIAAEFLGHSIPRLEGDALISEDYVVVETAFFGPADARLKISREDFSLRINDKKSPVPSTPFGMVFRSLKDPDWVPPDQGESKSKTSFGSGGKGGDAPPPPRMPLELVRAMQQRVQKVALPEGDRVLPHAGYIFFPYRGKVENIHSLELTYDGPAGKATLTLQP